MNRFESSWSQSSAPGMSFLSQWDNANNTEQTVRHQIMTIEAKVFIVIVMAWQFSLLIACHNMIY